MICCRKMRKSGVCCPGALGSIYAAPNYSWPDSMFQVPWILKFEVVNALKCQFYDLPLLRRYCC